MGNMNTLRFLVVNWFLLNNFWKGEQLFKSGVSIHYDLLNELYADMQRTIGLAEGTLHTTVFLAILEYVSDNVQQE